MSKKLKTTPIPGVRLDAVIIGFSIIVIISVLTYIAVRIEEKDTLITKYAAKEALYVEQIALLNEDVRDTRASIDKWTINVCKQLGFKNPYEHDGIIESPYIIKEGTGG